MKDKQVINREFSKSIALALLATSLGALATPVLAQEGTTTQVDEAALAAVIASPLRQQDRDDQRHPQQTLEFFDVSPDMTVVEIWPGGGWYSRILAPYLKDHGQYYAAHFDPAGGPAYYARSLASFNQQFIANPAQYGNIKVTVFHPPELLEIAPAGSADRILTFRNIHNWYMEGGDQTVAATLAGFFQTLKPGGILGVVEHRLPEDRPDSAQDSSGYMKQSYVIKMAKQAGFQLVASSEINANPKDSADYPAGVWTLPPSLRLGDTDKQKYLAIGESDRMTLKFRRPEQF
ncbi:class I SAM-dependent methyltransferase [Oceanobacter mangrovi]|uniref:class I SAM-dependent methyltransferase n=1 Tax=Oceanobacter mangrovi TaxID=2862510 RepID=UPI001FEA93E2|nr:methyltransferase [Oceanobacter mangrovi]